MILVFDIGNSAIKSALFDGDRIVGTDVLERRGVEANPEVAFKDLAVRLGAFVSDRLVTRAGCVSVVPADTVRLSQAVQSVLGLSLEVLTTKSSVPLAIDYLTPHTLGVDRLAAAVAGRVLFGTDDDGNPRNVVVIDAGTSTTTEVISTDGRYLGGSIGPGAGLMRTALHTGTAQLPTVELVIPESPIGRSTDEAMRAGILFGYLGSVEGLITRLAEILPTPIVFVATGGWAQWLAERIPDIMSVEPNLVLHGVRLMLEANG